MDTDNSHQMIPGDLIWSKVGKYPYWPCMIVYKPDEATYTKIQNGNKIYFVQFFGKKALRGWAAPGKNTFSYEGIAKFPFEEIKKYYDLKYSMSSSGENGNLGLQKKKKGSFCIKTKYLKDWRHAVREAEEALLENDVKERFRSYVFDYEIPKEKISSKNSLNDTNTSIAGKENEITTTCASKQQVSKAKSKSFSELEIKTNKCYICFEKAAEFSCVTCFKRFHVGCLGLLRLPEQFKCWECESGFHNCDSCKKSDVDVIKCSNVKCFRFFHAECLKKLEYGKPSSHLCPYHTCMTCFKENPRNIMARKGSFVTCEMCPTAYHAKESCIPAGSVENLPQFLIICPLHMTGKKRCSQLAPCNVTYCVICTEGGELICCEGCPNAYHETCLDRNNLTGEFYCEDCIKNKQYYYEMVVWCKIGKYRWWPAKIIQPSKLPDSVKNHIHFPGEFPVQCYGTYDYSWTHRGRVIPYEDKHKNMNISTQGQYEKHYKKALAEAEVAFNEYMAYRRSESQCSDTPEEYRSIKSNRITDGSLITVLEAHDFQCNCKDTDENPCGTASCINQAMLVECKLNKCQTGDKCQNQRIQKRQYKTTKLFKTNGRGWGLKAAEHIKTGEFVIEYVGEIISHEEYRKRSGEMQGNKNTNYYFLYLDSRRMIDAGPMGNKARFINHSCEPNCQMVKWLVNGDSRIGIFALHNISPGEELSFDYESDKYDFEQSCFCGSSKCKGFIGKKPKDVNGGKKITSINKFEKSAASKSSESKKSKRSISSNSSVKRHCGSKVWSAEETAKIPDHATRKLSVSTVNNTKYPAALLASTSSSSGSNNVINDLEFSTLSSSSVARSIKCTCDISIPITPLPFSYLQTSQQLSKTKKLDSPTVNNTKHPVNLVASSSSRSNNVVNELASSTLSSSSVAGSIGPTHDISIPVTPHSYLQTSQQLFPNYQPIPKQLSKPKDLDSLTVNNTNYPVSLEASNSSSSISNNVVNELASSTLNSSSAARSIEPTHNKSIPITPRSSYLQTSQQLSKEMTSLNVNNTKYSAALVASNSSVSESNNVINGLGSSTLSSSSVARSIESTPDISIPQIPCSSYLQTSQQLCPNYQQIPKQSLKSKELNSLTPGETLPSTSASTINAETVRDVNNGSVIVPIPRIINHENLSNILLAHLMQRSNAGGLEPIRPNSTTSCNHTQTPIPIIDLTTDEDPQSTVEDSQPSFEDPQPTVEDPQPTIEDPQSTVEDPQSTVESLSTTDEQNSLTPPNSCSAPIDEDSSSLSDVDMTPPKPNEDNHCFVCKNPGQLVCCGRKRCPRVYHVYCIGLRGTPRGKWSCPHHSCKVCKKTATILCGNCPTSFCKKCFKGNLITKPFYCQVCGLIKKNKK